MPSKPTAAALLRANMTFLKLATEAQTVIAMRTLGMMGLWNTASDEDQRMVEEKTDAFTKSAIATAAAIARGASPDQIAMAGMRPLRQKTRPNAARLTKAGPKSPL